MKAYNLIKKLKQKLKERYLTKDKIKKLGLRPEDIMKLIEETGEIEKYLTKDKIEELGLRPEVVVKLIKETGEIEKYLTKDKRDELNLDSDVICELIIEKNRNKKEEIEKYLTKENIEEFRFGSKNISKLIAATGEIEKYLTKENIRKLGFNSYDIVTTIERAGVVDEYLVTGKMAKLGVPVTKIFELIKETGEIEKYLTKDIVTKLGLMPTQVAWLIKETGEIEKYLKADEIKGLQLKGEEIAYLMDIQDLGFKNYINNEIEKGTYNDGKIKLIWEYKNILSKSNSSELQKVSLPIALQIYNLPEERREKAQLEIRNIFEASNLPNFAKNYLVFRYMHPALLEEDQNILRDSSDLKHIPSLQGISPEQKRKIIFTDLLKINIESNNRNLREYVTKIEKGNKLFEEILQGNLNLDKEIPKNKKESIEQYCQILNSIYCQMSRKERSNSQNLQQNVNELCRLFNIDEHGGIEELPNRIVKKFGKTLGITTLQQVKEKMNSIVEQTTEENKKNARIGITLEEGDLAKGINATSYVHSMFQNGIVARDYLGGNADSDLTPGDTDVELITSVGKNFSETYKSLKTAPKYSSDGTYGREMGKVIFIFGSNEFIKTRGENSDKDSVDEAQNDIGKTEYFDNNGTGGVNAYGVRTGIGSSRIKCIIAPSYVDKLRT